MSDEQTMAKLDTLKRTSQRGGEYWMARDVQTTLGYEKWENFRGIVKKAMESCRSGGIDVRDHFLSARKMVSIGSGAKVEVEDYFLTRYASYLTAMNGEASKPEIACAQRYFAVQTRLQELDRRELNDRERLRLRGQLKEATKHLHSAAAQAGVQNYGLFHHAGYLGLYDMGLSELKRRKRLNKDEDLYDRAGRLELSANEFKANLTERSILAKNIKGQQAAENEHKRMGRVVRDTIHREIGVYPEDLPTEPPIKAVERQSQTELPPSPRQGCPPQQPAPE